MKQYTDILIVGGGSSGFGAAYRILCHGKYTVTLVEPNPGLGGTSTYGGINCWEPGYSGHGVHHVLAELLQKEGSGFVGKTYVFASDLTPWGRSGPCSDPYEETLIRSFRTETEQRRFHFEPEAMAYTMLKLLHCTDSAQKATCLFHSRVTAVEATGRRITAITAETPEGPRTIVPKLVLDCTGDLIVARSAGCACALGEDAQSVYGEPNAPECAQSIVNGLTLAFRVTPCPSDYIEEIPVEYADVDLSDWLTELNRTNRPLSCFNDYPNGDININMLPTLPGEYWLNHTYEEVMHICKARIYSYWNWIQVKKHFTGYRIKEIFPMPGIRESWRLLGKYVLKEQDLRNGFSAELGPERTVAYADHPADLHGKSNKKGGMSMFAPYGIPYECLLPREIDNLLVACRGASFSHIALSSVRLSRTMMALGEAAGEAAVLALDQDCAPEQIDLSKLRSALGIQ